MEHFWKALAVKTSGRVGKETALLLPDLARRYSTMEDMPVYPAGKHMKKIFLPTKEHNLTLSLEFIFYAEAGKHLSKNTGHM